MEYISTPDSWWLVTGLGDGERGKKLYTRLCVCTSTYYVCKTVCIMLMVVCKFVCMCIWLCVSLCIRKKNGTRRKIIR